jgi:hypothetical protein
MLSFEYYERFEETLAALPEIPLGKKYEKSDLICSRFWLFSDGGLDVYYVPFHHAGSNARVALVGLTPGFTQMEEAFRAAKAGKRDGLIRAALFAHIDSTGSFSGPMRSNGENYNGSLIRVPALRKWVLQNLAAELAALPESAIIIPLGKGAGEAVDLITAEGLIDARRCLAGFPHPSGANGHGRRLFAAGLYLWREQLKSLLPSDKPIAF